MINYYVKEGQSLADLCNGIQFENPEYLKDYHNQHCSLSENFDSDNIVQGMKIYIPSSSENNAKEKIKEDKVEGYKSYIVSNSKISQITETLKKKYLLSKIQDPDGYTNLRKDKNTSSEVLQKVKLGENIEVLDNTGDWFLVKTKEGKERYIHKAG